MPSSMRQEQQSTPFSFFENPKTTPRSLWPTCTRARCEDGTAEHGLGHKQSDLLKEAAACVGKFILGPAVRTQTFEYQLRRERGKGVSAVEHVRLFLSKVL